MTRLYLEDFAVGQKYGTRRLRVDAVLPKSPLGDALRYIDNQWRALHRFVEDGNLSIDNNGAERQLRAVALGRKNWLFAGSLDGLDRAALLYSLAQSCRLVGIDPFEYFRDVLLRVATHPQKALTSRPKLELPPAAPPPKPIASPPEAGTPFARRLTSGLTYIEHQCIRLLRMDMSKDLVAASATPLVLAILAEGDSYGYAIIKRVAELSGGHLQWTDGMLYPVLHRLERQGLVAAKWSASENGRRRKYYRITREGRAQLAAQRQQWQVVDSTLRGIWMQACTA